MTSKGQGTSKSRDLTSTTISAFSSGALALVLIETLTRKLVGELICFLYPFLKNELIKPFQVFHTGMPSASVSRHHMRRLFAVAVEMQRNQIALVVKLYDIIHPWTRGNQYRSSDGNDTKFHMMFGGDSFGETAFDPAFCNPPTVAVSYNCYSLEPRNSFDFSIVDGILYRRRQLFCNLVRLALKSFLHGFHALYQNLCSVTLFQVGVGNDGSESEKGGSERQLGVLLQNVQRPVGAD
mmetsp:Transcript_18372/g.34105  ORF Transcript_18372/g.34105 Transcript_18372/m.34105 type:complete len:238 (-) Transcript_18372:235-948(-)